MILAYSIMVIVSILLAFGYFVIVQKKDKWLIVLYVACISNADNIPLNNTTTIVKKMNTVIG